MMIDSERAGFRACANDPDTLEHAPPLLVPGTSHTDNLLLSVETKKPREKSQGFLYSGGRRGL